jgi:hypothetical protein
VGETFLCSRCGQPHPGPAFHHDFPAPDAWTQLSDRRRELRGYLEDELCVVDDQHFIKGNLWITVKDADQDLDWTVWAAISAAGFERSVELWDQAGRESEPAYAGTLANEIPLFPGSLGLPLQVNTLSVGERPWLQLLPGDHALVEEQLGGISIARVQEIAELLAHL